MLSMNHEDDNADSNFSIKDSLKIQAAVNYESQNESYKDSSFSNVKQNIS